MGKRTDVEIEKVYRLWKERLTDTDFRGLPFTKQGAMLGVSPTTISKWHGELSPAQWENIRKMTIERVAPQSVKINDALYQKCLQGDVQAIKLWKENIEGWVPRQDMGLSRARDKELDAMANDDLVKMLVKDWSRDKKQALLDNSLGGGAVGQELGSTPLPLERGANEEASRPASDVHLEELKEMTGGDGPSEWAEADRKHPKSSSIYKRGEDA